MNMNMNMNMDMNMNMNMNMNNREHGNIWLPLYFSENIAIAKKSAGACLDRNSYTLHRNSKYTGNNQGGSHVLFCNTYVKL